MKPIPPESLSLEVGGGFEPIGQMYFDYFRDLCAVKPSDKILDLGCGCGRMAVPFIGFLTNGEYHGIDVEYPLIQWCKENITQPQFHFYLENIYNNRYNPHGVFKASEYKLPFPDGNFDFTFLTSVFTHMLLKDVENYLSEISRTLKLGGKCFITFFLLNSESLKLMLQPDSRFNFQFDHSCYRVVNEDVPEEAIAYDEKYVLKLYKKYNLKILDIKYGCWCPRKTFLSLQDILIAEKMAKSKWQFWK